MFRIKFDFTLLSYLRNSFRKIFIKNSKKGFISYTVQCPKCTVIRNKILVCSFSVFILKFLYYCVDFYNKV